MNKLRILHIVSWFPSDKNKFSGVFAAEHIKALNKFCSNEVLHITFSNKTKKLTVEEFDTIKVNRIVKRPIPDRWRIKEIMAKRSVSSFLKQNGDRFDIVNFYVAYPNAIALSRFKQQFPKLKFTITEVWSAYQRNFGLKENSKGRDRIAAIFDQDTPVFTVSSALGEDIRRFTGIDNLDYKIVPNIADTDFFGLTAKKENEPFTFCSINNWSKMKNPLPLIEAFHHLHKKDQNTRLVLAGTGPLLSEMEQLVSRLELNESVTFAGRLNKPEVAKLLQSAHVYCQSSHYETFSVICVEALCCGTPVVASNIGGMKDFIRPENGILVDGNTTEDWQNALENIQQNYHHYDLKKISQTTSVQFNAETIGSHYYNLFKALIN